MVAVNIEIAVSADTTTIDRGRVLENFARELLETQNYKVEQEVRITGSEVDLLAIEKSTSERVTVECKGHRQNIAAEVINKLLGNVTIHDFSAGWLISTFALSKDAKGLRDKWGQKPPAERRKLLIFDPPLLADRLISARVIVDPASLNKPTSPRYGDEFYLLLTTFGEFWAVLMLEPETGIRQAALLYEARTGNQVMSAATLALIAATDSTIASLNWIAGTPASQEKEAIRLKNELQSIVQVPMADHWADYRPARPEDFIGRDKLQKDVFEFFEKVRVGQTQTRLLAIKAPSGWGKSSAVLKLAARAGTPRNRGKTFIFAVDSRAAVSKRFGELALFTTVKKAIDLGFVRDPGNFSFGGADNPFSTEAMKEVLKSLAIEKKVICLIFDQFEELLYKDELELVFDEIKALCNAVDEAQENIVIGFSWKTDGTIPPEHKAYHLWHSLADRRLEFELQPFTSNEVTAAINNFAREMDKALAPQLRRLLQDHCQGYPWLLKKICIHILDLTHGGMDQSDILIRSLSIQDLFKRDMELMSAVEYACIRQISQEAPAEFFKIVNVYGDEVVNQLLGKRLIIRSGPRLSIYWDIFRDYILTERVPYIPISYIPQVPLVTYVSAVKYVIHEKDVTYDALASELHLAKGTVDNVVRDLVMIGNAEASRKVEAVRSLQTSEQDANRVILEFCMSHILYREMLNEIGPGAIFSDRVLERIARRVLTTSAPSDRLLEIYMRKMLRWFLAVRLVERDEKNYVLCQRPNLSIFLDATAQTNLRRRSTLFLAEAPPSHVVAAVRSSLENCLSLAELGKRYGRNTIAAMLGLNLIGSGNRVETPSELLLDEVEEFVRKIASQTETLSFTQSLLTKRPSASGELVGEALAERFACDWASGSKKRHGTALRQWAVWVSGLRKLTKTGTRKRTVQPRLL